MKTIILLSLFLLLIGSGFAQSGGELLIVNGQEMINEAVQRALQDAKGDIDQAIEILRKKGFSNKDLKLSWWQVQPIKRK